VGGSGNSITPLSKTCSNMSNSRFLLHRGQFHDDRKVIATADRSTG
jgi:hypothetical protein